MTAEPGTSSAYRSPTVCPNDRNLALRAVLNRGWCQKSADGKVTPFTKKEIDSIRGIVSADERMQEEEEKSRRELTDQYISLKSLAKGNGQDSCTFCGNRLTFFSWARPCHSCQKKTCRSCFMKDEATSSPGYCKVCFERRKLQMRTGFWLDHLPRLPSWEKITPREQELRQRRDIPRLPSGGVDYGARAAKLISRSHSGEEDQVHSRSRELWRRAALRVALMRHEIQHDAEVEEPAKEVKNDVTKSPSKIFKPLKNLLQFRRSQ